MVGKQGIHLHYCGIGARTRRFLFEAKYDYDELERIATREAKRRGVQLCHLLLLPAELHLLIYGHYRDVQRFFGELLKRYGTHFKDRVDRRAPYTRPFHDVIPCKELGAMSRDMTHTARNAAGEVRHWHNLEPLKLPEKPQQPRVRSPQPGETHTPRSRRCPPKKIRSAHRSKPSRAGAAPPASTRYLSGAGLSDNSTSASISG